MTAKEVLNKMEFGSWDAFRNYVTSKLEEKFGVRSSINGIVKIDGMIVHKKNLSTLPSPNKGAITALIIDTHY